MTTLRRLGATELHIAPLILGGNVFGWTADRDTSFAVLDAFVAHGGEMVDTSPTYGNAETVIGELARDTGLRDELFMATKVHIRGVAEGKQQMDTSAERLGKPVDLMQIHNFVDLETQWATLKARKAAGRYRYIGITHYLTRAFERLEQEMRDKALDFVQFNYSIMLLMAQSRRLTCCAHRNQTMRPLFNLPVNQFFKGTLIKPPIRCKWRHEGGV